MYRVMLVNSMEILKMNTRVWHDSKPKRNKASEEYKNRMIAELTRLGQCPKRPHEIKKRTLEELVRNARLS